MRISTLSMYTRSGSAMNRAESDFIKIGAQLTSRKRVTTPSDDPLAMSKATNIAQSKAVNKQFADARVAARNSLGQEESVLNSVSDAISSIKTLLVKASSDTLTDADRASIATEVKGIYETIIGQANSADGNGRYLFGGYQDGSPPYVQDALGNVSYVGDTGQAMMQVDSSRLMKASDIGPSIFNSVIGSAAMVATADSANTGSIQIATPTVTNSSDPSYRTAYSIEFSDVAGVPHYSVDGGAAVAYNSGDKITANGVSIVLKGTPNAGDKVTVTPGGSGDLFGSIKNAIDALSNPVATPADKAGLVNNLNTTMNELTNSLDNVLTVRASVGSRLNELDVIDTVGTNKDLNYTAAISELIDLDYNTALSEYALKQIGLSASQKAFVDMQGMSIFNYIK